MKRSLGGFRYFFALAVTGLFIIPTARAQQGTGVRAGISVNPEQFYLGGHVDVGPVTDRLWFRPNVEVGFGNDLTTVALNGEFAYWLPLRQRPWSAYFGGGPAINIFSSGRSPRSHTSVDPGFNFLLGLAQDRGLFAELKIGVLDSPDLKFGIGYTFR